MLRLLAALLSALAAPLMRRRAFVVTGIAGGIETAVTARLERDGTTRILSVKQTPAPSG